MPKFDSHLNHFARMFSNRFMFSCWFFLITMVLSGQDLVKIDCSIENQTRVSKAPYLDGIIEDFHPKSFEDSAYFFILKMKALKVRPFEGAKLLDELKVHEELFTSVSFCYYSANCAFMSGQFYKAIYCYRKVLENLEGSICINKDRRDFLKNAAFVGLGSSYNNLSLYDSAIANYEQVDIDRVSLVVMMNNIASVYLNIENYGKAKEYLMRIPLEEVTTVNQTYMTHLNFMNAELGLGNFNELKIWSQKTPQDQFPYGDTLMSLTTWIHTFLALEDTLSLLHLINANQVYIEEHKEESKLMQAALELRNLYSFDSELFSLVWNSLEPRSIQQSDFNLNVRLPWKTFLMGNNFVLEAVLTLILLIGLISGWMINIIYARTHERSFNQKVSKDFSKLKGPEKAFLKTLTITEKQALHYFIKSLTAKEVAQEINRSVGYVYQIKASMKKKFQESVGNADFEEWLRTRF